MNNQNDLSARTLTIKRSYDAPIHLVWEAWTNPEHISKWWGPPGVETTIIEHDFRVGGQWHYKMPMPNGHEFHSDGIYSVIVDLEKIYSSANFRPMTEGVEIQSRFSTNGQKTDHTFHCIHPSAEYCKQQEQMGFYKGWNSVFDNLDRFLNR